ncbi:MAG: FAD-binding protein, partial [Atopobiaceae bacterium]|nr:FAD-binding protein [Atopobiaceae bacterium]
MTGDGRERTELVWRLRQIVGEDNVSLDEPLSEHTTFEIGGPADVYVVPEDSDEVREVIAACREAEVPFFVLGNGSDLLVSDDGYRGVIVGLADGFTNVSIDGTEITCQAGVSLREASEMACELGLTGLEFACGIPGTIGGACFMNAGAYDGCIADVLKCVRVLKQDGALETIGVADLALGYRASRIRDEGLVVLTATFALRKGDPDTIRAHMDELTHKRESKQPLDKPSA